jgi:hypothetical protein
MKMQLGRMHIGGAFRLASLTLLVWKMRSKGTGWCWDVAIPVKPCG